jgi:hypothetical protein
MRASVVICAVLTLLTAPSASSAEPVDPAQAIAQKFLDADRPAQPPPKARPKPKLPSAVQSQTGAPGLDYETDMLQRARAEDVERRRNIATTEPLVVAEPAPALAPPPVAEPPPMQLREPDPVAEPLTAVPPPAAKLRRTAEAQPAQADNAVAPSDTRATVLLVLDPDDTDQAHVKPDPIICFDQQCWISNGLDAPAKPMPRSQAIALKTTETPTGDSCSGKSGCAFRNVAFRPDTQIQVVEVGESRGVSGGAYTVAADTTCRKVDGNLMCDNALVTHAFRMWIVPEQTARQVGDSVLEDAVADGLQNDGTGDDNAADGK